MNPYNIHTEIMMQIQLPKYFSLTIDPRKLSEHIAYWNGRGFRVTKGKPISERKMKIKVMKNGMDTNKQKVS